jgi:hypothetical protein
MQLFFPFFKAKSTVFKKTYLIAYDRPSRVVKIPFLRPLCSLKIAAARRLPAYFYRVLRSNAIYIGGKWRIYLVDKLTFDE